MNYTEICDMLVHDVLSKKDGLTAKEIIAIAVEKQSNGQLFPNSDFNQEEFVKGIRAVLKEEPKNQSGVIMQCSKKRKGAFAYKVRPVRGARPVTMRPESDTTDTNYIGKAGEFAVLSELVAAGYNANMMAIDEGIDIVASKNNIFYYIQVKTTYFDENGKCSIQIPRQNFERVYSGNVIYIGAIREKIGQFKLFVFSQRDIDKLVFNGYVDKTDSNIIIRIFFDSITNQPKLYNGSQDTAALSYLAGANGKLEL